ncbi:MAG TPA: DUF2188 domain-containing protein [Vicinamibacterales bacterium]|nr:DUF2188 domain-containing protein [Vicinamibacterales bacterium]
MKKHHGFHVVLSSAASRRSMTWSVEEKGKEICWSHTQRDAIRSGRALAIVHKTSLRIHGVNGKIRAEHSYGNETRRPG